MVLSESELRSPRQLPSLGLLSAAPQWQTSEYGMGDWLAAKIEEEKRKQEEEKTRQESLRLQKREIEQSMLRDSIHGGIPPQLVPTIFTCCSGAGSANMSTDWLQQYTVQLKAAHDKQLRVRAQMEQPSDACKERNTIDREQSAMYTGRFQTSQSILPSAPAPPGQQSPTQVRSLPLSVVTTYANRAMSSETRTAQPLDRVNASRPSAALANQTFVHQTLPAQQQPTYASICFHQWVPPSSQPKKTPGVKVLASPSATLLTKNDASPSYHHHSVR